MPMPWPVRCDRPGQLVARAIAPAFVGRAHRVIDAARRERRPSRRGSRSAGLDGPGSRPCAARASDRRHTRRCARCRTGSRGPCSRSRTGSCSPRFTTCGLLRCRADRPRLRRSGRARIRAPAKRCRRSVDQRVDSPPGVMPSLASLAGVAHRAQRDVVGRLHQRELGRRLDHAAARGRPDWR